MNLLLAVAAYVFTPVVVPGSPQIFGFFGPNDTGQIVLNTTIGSGVYGDGTFTPLPPAPPGYEVSATGINDAGTVVGAAVTAPDFREQGFILTGSTYRFFARPGWANTVPRFIGNSGLVTGGSFDNSTGQSAGFVYDPATHKFTDATPPGSDFTIVQGINTSGVISGNGDDSLGNYGFIWQQGKFAEGQHQVPFIDRFLVANENGRARGINDAGLIVGFTSSGSSGFVGNTVLGFQLLNPGDHVHGARTYCQGINNSGQVVCGYDIDNDVHYHVFIGTPHDGDDQDGDQGRRDPR